MNFTFSDNVRILCLSFDVKNSETTAENKRHLNRCLMVSSEKVRALLLTCLTVTLHEWDTRKSMYCSVTVNNKKVSSKRNLTPQIEQVQYKYYYLNNIT